MYEGKTRLFFGMAYKGSDVGMLFALAKGETGRCFLAHHFVFSAALGEVELAIDKTFSRGEYDVVVRLPKFKLDCKTTDLINIFQGLGIGQLFSGKVVYSLTRSHRHAT